MKIYKQVLDIVPLYADAHVAWGAAYAALLVFLLLLLMTARYVTAGQLLKAVGEFEAALAIDPAHHNARKYLDV